MVLERIGTTGTRFSGLLAGVFVFFCAVANCSVSYAQAQVVPVAPVESVVPVTKYTGGVQLLLSNSGFGFGGYLRDSVDVVWALSYELSIGPSKDEREVAFFNRFGDRSVPGKANYLLTAPLRFGVQRRVFRNKIEDGFRPFLQVLGGPTIGWQYPYFDDCNNNGLFESTFDCDADGFQETDEGDKRLSTYRAIGRGTVRIGAGGAIGVGAFIGSNRRGPRGFRVSYAFDYFFEEIRLLEADITSPRHYFGSPSVAVFVGSVF